MCYSLYLDSEHFLCSCGLFEVPFINALYILKVKIMTLADCDVS